MKIVLSKEPCYNRLIIEQPCTACKKQIGYFEFWNYCIFTPHIPTIIGGLCEECAKYMDSVGFK